MKKQAVTVKKKPYVNRDGEIVTRREHFRGVVWPKGEVAPGRYQYVVVGIIVTDEPVEVGVTHPDAYMDGSTSGKLLDTLRELGTYNAPSRFGDASDLLCSLDRCSPATDGKCKAK